MSPPPDSEYMVFHSGLARDYDLYAFFDVGLVSTILRSQWQVRKVGRITIELDAEIAKLKEQSR